MYIFIILFLLKLACSNKSKNVLRVVMGWASCPCPSQNSLVPTPELLLTKNEKKYSFLLKSFLSIYGKNKQTQV